MADLKRWFKVWTTILDDPHFQELSLEQIGRWALLGAMLASVGSKGRLRSPAAARRLLEVLRLDSVEALMATLNALPNVRVEHADEHQMNIKLNIKSTSLEQGSKRNGDLIVTMMKWPKYQVDSTVGERVKRLRSKKREEEKREEEIHTTPDVQLAFDAFWAAYPRHEAKARALKAWRTIAPANGLTQTILTALDQHNRAWHGKEPDKIPHAATWLNGRRWEDELAPTTHDPYAKYPRT